VGPLFTTGAHRHETQQPPHRYATANILITVLIIFSTVELLITLSISTDLGASG